MLYRTNERLASYMLERWGTINSFASDFDSQADRPQHTTQNINFPELKISNFAEPTVQNERSCNNVNVICAVTDSMSLDRHTVIR